MRTAQEMETKLVQEEEVCNDTMKALWEECKPCLKNTCVKYYSRTCSSGSGLVGRQVRPSHVHLLYTHTSVYYMCGADYIPDIMQFVDYIIYSKYSGNTLSEKISINPEVSIKNNN